MRARHGPPVRTVRPSRSRARFRVPCGAASAHHARNLVPDGGPGTVRASRSGARFRVPCGAASAHHARNLVPDGGPGTVRVRRRPGGTVRARHGPPVRTVRPSRSRARFRVPCRVAGAHHARKLAPDGGPGTVRASRSGARFRVLCSAASAHHARNLAPDGGHGTVRGRRRPGGAVRARHGPPVRTVRPSRSRATSRVPCGAASAHHVRNLAPGGGPAPCRHRRVSPRASPSPTRMAAARPAPHRRRAAPHPAR